MKTKWDFPEFWDEATDSAYSAASSKIRVRAASAAKLIPPGRQSLSDLDKAHLLLVHYASNSHLLAADAAKRIGALDTPTKECGAGDGHWPKMGVPFEEVLAGLIWAARNGGNDLAGISICTSHPEVAIYFNDAELRLEGYRYFDGLVVPRFSIHKTFIDIPARAIQALSNFGFEGFR